MRQRNILYSAIIFSLLIMAGYIYIYLAYPLPESWNDVLIDAADPFVTLLAAICVTAVLFSYQRDDKPYVVWLYFTISMWFWVFAESVFGYLYFVLGDVPPQGLADVLWFIGYGLLGIALYKQYQLVSQEKIALWKPIAIWAAVILLCPVVIFLLHAELSVKSFVDYLYPLVDFTVCIVAFRLYIVFGGGKLSRPWIGLFVLGIADAIWAWLAVSGGDQFESLSIFADATYVAAYLILALGFLRQYLLLHFGPE